MEHSAAPASWANWPRTQRCTPVALERPGSRREVAAAVERAAAAGRTVRVAGAGHSFSPAALTDGTLLRLDRLDRVLDADPASGLVRVEAGISLHALNRELLARGLALPNLGDIDIQSLAGALATATHGTGARLGNLSTQVEAMELVLGDGTVRTLTGDDGDLLRAARVGLGSLGAVTAVTLRCVPAFRLRGVDRPEPLEDVLASLDERADAHDHFEFWTFPHSPLALTRTNDRTDEPAAPPPRPRAWLEDVLLDNHAFHAVNLAARRFPRAIPWLNRFAARAAAEREQVDWSFRVFASSRLVRFDEMEYAIPRGHAGEAVRACREILERHPISFPIELRLVAGDDALLSPAHGRDTAYVAVHVFTGMDGEAMFREVEALMGDWGGRPHWGKRSFLTAARLAGRYPRWDAFAAARAELDPDGRFESGWARRVLGPVRQRNVQPSPR
jgi:L-gulono-1,4-lactone dehydrogenase